MRSRCLRLALAPAVSMGLLGSVVLALVLVAEPPATVIFWVLITAAAGALLIVAWAAKAAGDLADAAGRYLRERFGALNRTLDDGQQLLGSTVQDVQAGRSPALPGTVAQPTSNDLFNQFEAALRNAFGDAAWAVLDVADHQKHVNASRRFTAFSKIAWRLQSLLHGQILLFDQLEKELEDPGLLAPIYRADHLATRMRRLAESLAVIGGNASRRRWNEPESVYQVARSAVSAVEHYQRVRVQSAVQSAVAPVAVASVGHLLAELIENATTFSPGQVTVTTERVRDALVIQIADHGLGMPADQREQLNTLLDDPSQVDLPELLQDGRFGLYVVAVLARRHRIRVELCPNAAGGTLVTVTLPKDLIVQRRASQQPEPSPTRQTGVTGRFSAAPRHSALAGTSRSPQESGTGYNQRLMHPGRSTPDAPMEHPGYRAQASPVPAQPPLTAQPLQQGSHLPPLPQRRPQEHLPAEPRDPQAPRYPQQPGHTPGLMADFQAGWRRPSSPPAGDEHPATCWPAESGPADERSDVHNEGIPRDHPSRAHGSAGPDLATG